MAGVDAFGLLKEELKSEDIQDQVNAARRVNTIALSMGRIVRAVNSFLSSGNASTSIPTKFCL